MSILAKAYRRALATSVGLRLFELFTNITFRIISNNARKSKNRHVLLPTAGNGNIGDQAMVQAYLRGTGGANVFIVCEREDQFQGFIGEDYEQPVEVVIPGLYADKGIIAHIRAVRKFVALTASSDSLSVVGADIMDGGYSRIESVCRSIYLGGAARVEVRTRLLGFSWNEFPDRHALAYIRRASTRTRMVARDPLSFDRLQDHVKDLVLGSDLVFSRTSHSAPTAHSTWLQSGPADQRRVIVNSSGLLSKNIALREGYLQLVNELLDRDVRVLLLPHVIRDGDDDLSALKDLYARVSDTRGNLRLVSDLLSPDEVATVTKSADAVISSRMHLAIIALSSHTPAAVVTTQGKVEGLLRMFNRPQYVLPPDGNFYEAAVSALEYMEETGFGSDMQEALVLMQKRSMENFGISPTRSL